MPISSTGKARDMAKRRHSLDVYIRSIVDRAPELTAAQKDRLASLLRGARTSDDQDAA